MVAMVVAVVVAVEISARLQTVRWMSRFDLNSTHEFIVPWYVYFPRSETPRSEVFSPSFLTLN